jgi:ATP-dependent DNA ligase
VVAGFRWHKRGPKTHVGSLLLGIYDDEGTLQHVGIAAAFSMKRRQELAEELEPLRANALRDHPWREWRAEDDDDIRMPGGTSRWNRGKDLSWEPVRPERVCEVAFDHLQSGRFRHAAQFRRWRLDKSPRECRFDQLEERAPYELARIFKLHRGM